MPLNSGTLFKPVAIHFSRNACHDVSVKYRTGRLSQSITRALEKMQAAHVPTPWWKLSASKPGPGRIHANGPPLTEAIVIVGLSTITAISDKLVHNQTSLLNNFRTQYLSVPYCSLQHDLPTRTAMYLTEESMTQFSINLKVISHHHNFNAA